MARRRWFHVVESKTGLPLHQVYVDRCMSSLNCSLDRLLLRSLFILLAAAVIVQGHAILQAKENFAPTASIQFATIEESSKEFPRLDSGVVEEIAPGHLLLAYNRYYPSKKHGSDFWKCNVWMKESTDGGETWTDQREVLTTHEGDLNIQAPAMCSLPSGDILMIANRAHSRKSSSMELFRSKDRGKTWKYETSIWKRSNGQWLQGGAASLLRLKSGLLLLPVHGGVGDQARQKNDAWCFMSDDNGRIWRRSKGKIVLPMRGAMEASIAEMSDGELVASLRTQLGGPFITRSTDGGDTWDKAQPSGLIGGESCTCLRRIPGTDALILFWNNSKYEYDHHHYGERTPLSAAISTDLGRSWKKVADLESSQNATYSDIGCTFLANGSAILTYRYGEPAWNPYHLSLHSAIVPKFWLEQVLDKESRNPD